MVQTATKKRISVSFVKYDGTNHNEIIDFTGGIAKYDVAIGSAASGANHVQAYSKLTIPTKEGEMLVSEGDLVIKEPVPTADRQFYPCKPEIFNGSYEINEDAHCISKHEIVSAVCYWAVRQSPYLFPLNLTEALSALSDTIDQRKMFLIGEKKSPTFGSFVVLPKEAIKGVIRELIFGIPEIKIWNVTKIEQDKGITDPEDPNRTMHHAFVSQYGGPEADKDFIDLDALLRNVCNTLTGKNYELQG